MFILRDEHGGTNRNPGTIRVDSVWARWSCGIIFLLIVTSFCWEAAGVWIAAEYAASPKPELRRRAARWQPQNAAYWAQLGAMEAWDFERGDLEQAQADYERAIEANPYSDRNWLELAGVYERRGEISRARAAYERSQYNHPISSAVAWRYGNFLLRQGEASEACGQFRKALLTSPELTEDAVAEWWKTGLHSSQPIAKLFPPQNLFYFKALDYLAAQNDIDAALRVWDELLALGKHFALPEAIPFINETISAGRVADAQRIWRQALKVSAWPRDADQDSLLIFNGGFEHDSAGGGFDWRERGSADYSFAQDSAIAHSGAHSLRVSFNGQSNVDLHHVLQYVALEPAQRYKFAVFLKSSALSTDSGVRFVIADTRGKMSPVVTESITGTQPWMAIEREFVTGPETRLVSIALQRPPSSKFDNKLSGTMWVDDVSIVALAAKQHGGSNRVDEFCY